MRYIFFIGLMAVSTLMADRGGPKSIDQRPSILGEKLSIEPNIVNSNSQFESTMGIGDSVNIFFDDLEGDVSAWTFDGQWSLTTANSFSPSHSFVADDDPTGASLSDLISPVISLPGISDIEELKFEFALFCDFPDYDGDNDVDGLLEDYYFLKVADVDAIPWHRSGFNAFDGGTSWWCGSEDLQGYSDGWLQFLDTSPITLPAAAASLDLKLKYEIEGPAGASGNENGCDYDGWDAANIRISSDGGVTWLPLTGSPSYNFTSGFGFVFNNDICGMPGWGGSTGGWIDANFDLSAYANQEVIIRFAFGSDPEYSTPDDPSLTGIFLDNILVSTATDTLLYNDASDEVGLHTEGKLWADLFYDYGNPASPRPGSAGWEIYEEGMQFNVGGTLILDDFAGKDIQLMWKTRVDDNTDGGDGTGMHVDNISVYKDINLTIPPPNQVSATADLGEVQLSWSDMNLPQTVSFSYGDGEYDAFIPGSVPWTSGEVVGSGWASRYEAFFPTTLNSVSYVLSSAGSIAPIKIAVWGSDESILFQSTAITPAVTGVIQTFDLSAENITVSGKFYVGWTYTDITAPYVALDGNSPSTGEAYGWHPDGEMVPLTGGLDGNYALFAEGTTTSEGGFTYNVYRRTVTGDYLTPINGVPLTSPEFIDTSVNSGFGYFYAITTIFKGSESAFSPEVYAFPESPTVYTMAYDDGIAENGFNLGSGGRQAVYFLPTGHPAIVKRFSIFSSDQSEGNITAIIWDDDGVNGLPLSEMHRFEWTGVQPGWNTMDLTNDSIWVNDGGFYLGFEETESTPAIGADSDVYSGNSYYAIDEGAGFVWDNFSRIGLNYNMMIRAAIDREFAVTSIEVNGNGGVLPEHYTLEQNFPNPFNPSTEIRYFLPENSYVQVSVYDLNGRKISDLVQAQQSAGMYTVKLDGSNMSSGIYIYTLNAGRTQLTKKMILLK
jgi:hypothetical protein